RRLTRRAGEPPGPPPVEMADAVRQRLCILNGAPLVRIAPVPPVYLPETALLTATATDDGPTLVYRWRLASGPGAVAFDRPDTAVTRAAFGQGGTYVLEVAVSDGQYVATAQVSVVVHGPGSVNAPPVVTATAATPLRLGGNLLEAVAGDEEWDAQDRPRGVTAAAGNWRRPPLGAPGVPAPFAGTTYLWVEGIQPHLTWRVDLTALERPDLYDIV
ncbi:MAG: hypothetical protein RMK84_20630, partial [Oscillochloridaceae bacterium]|nr:hypothetical protein [Chloroflexaceae bacterium]MDW8392520.1 hypothetical protein [Oscillochloridaceae bacterium]